MPPVQKNHGLLDWLRLLLFWALGLSVSGILMYNALKGPHIRIQWTTESELDIVGFNLYRADSVDGEFVKINKGIIPPATDPMLGGEHQYIDADVHWLRTYYYSLESVDRTGVSDRSGPISLTAGPTLPFP